MSGNGRMNIVHAFRNRPQQALDRLVDGELGTDDRRALLAAFDDEPGAWRQCALAFVEAQAFGWQLARIAQEPLVAQESAQRQAASPPRKVGQMAWPLALAASVLIAFLVGRQAAVRQNAVPEMAGDNTNITAAEVASVDSPPTAEHDGELASVTVHPYGSDDAIELPLVESDDAVAAKAAGRSSAVSGALAHQFQRDGFEVDRQQRYWPMELPDGRSVLVPVEELNIQTPDVQRL